MKKINTSQFPVEFLFWTTALIALSLFHPEGKSHWSVCPLYNLGWERWCWGCGLGRSIAFALHGEFAQSFQMHSLGMPALWVIVYRWVQLGLFEMGKLRSKNNLKY